MFNNEICLFGKNMHVSVNQYFPNDQFMMSVKDLFRVQERSVNFNVSEYEKFSDMVSDSTLQVIFKKLPLVEFWSSVKEYPKLSEKAIKILLPFLSTYLYEARFSSKD